MERNNQLQNLTKAEEEIMHIIWELERCLVKDIIDKLGDPVTGLQQICPLLKGHNFPAR